MACCFKNLKGKPQQLDLPILQYPNIPYQTVEFHKIHQNPPLGALAFYQNNTGYHSSKKTLRNYCYCNKNTVFLLPIQKNGFHQQLHLTKWLPQALDPSPSGKASTGRTTFTCHRGLLARDLGFFSGFPQRLSAGWLMKHLLGSGIPTFVKHLADLLVILMTFCREVSLIYINNYIFQFRSVISSPCYTLWFLDPGSKSLKLKLVQEQIAGCKTHPYKGPMSNREDNQQSNKRQTHQRCSGNIFKTQKFLPTSLTPCIFRSIPAAPREALHSCWMYFGLSVLAFAPNVVAVDLTNTPPVGIDILGQNSPLPKGIAT